MKLIFSLTFTSGASQQEGYTNIQQIERRTVMINRAKLRGKPLDSDCKQAHRTTHEYGMKMIESSVMAYMKI